MFSDISVFGFGSAFSKDFSPTAMGFKKVDTYFFLEANQSTFNYLKTFPDFSGIKKFVFLVTHFHEDHAGCLGNCIAWLVYAMKVNLNQISVSSPNPSETKEYLSITMPSLKDVPIFNDVEKFKVSHADFMDCTGYIVDAPLGKLAYTGDCTEVPRPILEEFNSGNLRLITECTLIKGSEVHQYLHDLIKKLDFSRLGNLMLVHHDSKVSFRESMNQIEGAVLAYLKHISSKTGFSPKEADERKDEVFKNLLEFKKTQELMLIFSYY